MKWLLLILILFPALAFASEDCSTQFRGKCRDVCTPDEAAEQGAFIDCAENQQCCVPKQALKTSGIVSSLVLIDQMAFSPDVLKVKAGTEVIWKNKDSSLHTVTSDDGSFSSGPLDLEGEFKKIFTKPGTYSYACEMHPFMSGKIVVE